MTLAFCTICCTNYLPKAIALADSLKRHHPTCSLSLCLVERSAPTDWKLDAFDEVILARDLFEESFEWMLFKYDQLEASTSVKATFIAYLLKHNERVVYLDPDICVYSPLEEIVSLPHSVLVTPHQLWPVSDLKVIDSSVIGFLLCGIFNLGFLAVTRSPATTEFLTWWEHKLRYYAFVDFARGLFTDQKWIDLAYTLFDLTALRHEGYNVANWNINERELMRDAGGTILVNTATPLRFFHFSGIDSGKDLRILRLLASSDTFRTAVLLRKDYKKAIQRPDLADLYHIPWSYDFFDSGERINKLSRTAFFRSRKLRKKLPNPFGASNEKILSIGY